MPIHNPAPYKHHPPAAGPIPPALNQPLPQQQAHGGSWGKLRYHFISSRHSLEAAGCNPEQRSQLFPIVTGWDRSDANELPAPTCRHRAARGRERHEQPWGLMPRRKHLSGWHRPSSILPRSCRAPPARLQGMDVWRGAASPAVFPHFLASSHGGFKSKVVGHQTSAPTTAEEHFNPRMPSSDCPGPAGAWCPMPGVTSHRVEMLRGRNAPRACALLRVPKAQNRRHCHPQALLGKTAPPGAAFSPC